MAEELVKDIPSVEKKIIDQHAHFAALLALTLYLLGVISAAGIFINFRKNNRTRPIAFLAILLAIIGVFFIFQAGKSGGDIQTTSQTASTVFKVTWRLCKSRAGQCNINYVQAAAQVRARRSTFSFSS